MAQNAMGSLHPQLSQIPVTFFRDRQLWLALARITLLGTQSHKATYVPALGESLSIFHSQDKCQSDQRPYAAHLPQQARFRILSPGDLLYLDITFFDLFGQRFYFLQQRP